MIPVFSVVLCSLSFHWIEHLVMELPAASPSFFKRRDQKNKRKKKKNKRKQRRPDAFNRLNEWFKHFYVVAGSMGLRDWFFVEISGSSLQRPIHDWLSRFLVQVFKN
jgi:hypothetical protein